MREKISSHDLTQNSILRINDTKTLQLISEYKKEPCLWNSSLDDYPNKTKRARAAEKIARILNIKNFEGKHVMIKFKNLRNSYSQELKKIKYSLDKVGPNSPELYKPKVPWFPLMDSFIRPHLQTSRLLGNDFKQNEMVTNVKMECYDIDEQDDWGIQAQIDLEPIANYSQSEEQSENEEVSEEPRAKRRRRSSSGPSDHYSQSQQIFLNEVTPVTAVAGAAAPVAARAEDTYDVVGKYVASLLRSLPPQKALRLQPRIVDMIVTVSVTEEENKVKETHAD
ncbi:hypothetical protein PYW08_004777 [Mythimna loreyi]|uniref:Uncharacterized protein n=1 Tax=Mythimna loreyi TaxID=667449 RepID=A0ACC2QDL1_9NEOP|nr:hypothetical protein PYW08_004777 [Mythimna loreyi]